MQGGGFEAGRIFRLPLFKRIHLFNIIRLAQQAAAFRHKAHLPKVFLAAVGLQAGHGVGANRPIFRA